MALKPLTYVLVIQCVRSDIGVMAEYKASSPFPSYPKGGRLSLFDCDPRTWDVIDSMHRIVTESDGTVVCCTLLLVDSPVVENTGFVVRKQSGEEVGPSETRFGRIKTGDAL